MMLKYADAVALPLTLLTPLFSPLFSYAVFFFLCHYRPAAIVAIFCYHYFHACYYFSLLFRHFLSSLFTIFLSLIFSFTCFFHFSSFSRHDYFSFAMPLLMMLMAPRDADYAFIIGFSLLMPSYFRLIACLRFIICCHFHYAACRRVFTLFHIRARFRHAMPLCCLREPGVVTGEVAL